MKRDRNPHPCQTLFESLLTKDGNNNYFFILKHKLKSIKAVKENFQKEIIKSNYVNI